MEILCGTDQVFQFEKEKSPHCAALEAQRNIELMRPFNDKRQPTGLSDVLKPQPENTSTL